MHNGSPKKKEKRKKRTDRISKADGQNFVKFDERS